MDALKPCPFCGGAAGYHGECDMVQIACAEYSVQCNAETCWYDECEDAVKEWNTRPIEDALQAELAALKHLVECLDWEMECYLLEAFGGYVATMTTAGDAELCDICNTATSAVESARAAVDALRGKQNA